MKPKIDFVATVTGLDQYSPKPAKHYIPEWWKNMPSGNKDTVRHCPSFPDYFSTGFIIPMWTNSFIKYTENNDQWIAGSEEGQYWQNHSNKQMVDYKTPSFMNSEASFVFKAICPWKIITAPGWSVLQLPLFYHFNKEWSVMPGVIDTDIHHDINQQVLYHGNGKEVFIKKGDPFVLYIPFERNTIDFDVRYQTEEDNKKIKNAQEKILSNSLGDGAYRKMQRDRDKECPMK